MRMPMWGCLFLFLITGRVGRVVKVARFPGCLISVRTLGPSWYNGRGLGASTSSPVATPLICDSWSAETFAF